MVTYYFIWWCFMRKFSKTTLLIAKYKWILIWFIEWIIIILILIGPINISISTKNLLIFSFYNYDCFSLFVTFFVKNITIKSFDWSSIKQNYFIYYFWNSLLCFICIQWIIQKLIKLYLLNVSNEDLWFKSFNFIIHSAIWGFELMFISRILLRIAFKCLMILYNRMSIILNCFFFHDFFT